MCGVAGVMLLLVAGAGWSEGGVFPGYYGQYTPDFLGNEDLWALAADGRTGWGPFELEGEYVYTHYQGIQSVARRFAQAALQQQSES